MKKTVFFIALLGIALSNSLFAQKFSQDYWHLGEIDLTSGETIKGQLQYDLKNNQLVVRESDKLQVYRADNVEAFQFKDALTGESRVFFTLPYALQNNYTRSYFFELLKEGNINLLTREEVVQSTRYYNDPFWIGGSQAYTVLEQIEHFFLLDSEANIKPLEGSTSAILEMFPSKVEKLKDFIRDNRLRVNFRTDMAMVIEYYNQLQGGN